MTDPNQNCTLCAAGTYQTGTDMTDHSGSSCLLCQPGLTSPGMGFQTVISVQLELIKQVKGCPATAAYVTT